MVRNLPSIKSILPRSFFGRAVLIVVVPILLLQIVLSVVFVQRHYERVTQQMTGSMLDVVSVELSRLDALSASALDQAGTSDLAQAVGLDMKMSVLVPADVEDGVAWYDLAGREILTVLRDAVPGYQVAMLRTDPDRAVVWALTRHGPVQVSIPRNRLAPTNPHQLLVLVFVASLILVLIALQYLRLQIRPIRRLGAAAEAYGRGQSVPVRAGGAREIRAAALAFVDMRNRIERQNAQRKLMLSGLGHDMRTPLTRMRLMLSMAEPSDDRDALETEITGLEKLLDGFLDYARGEEPAGQGPVDPVQVVSDLVARYRNAGRPVALEMAADLPDSLWLRDGQLDRALDNILGNALEYGTRAHVCVAAQQDKLTIAIEDDGPGIAPEDRARACEPFVRLDKSRNQNAGVHVGLGLAIAMNMARTHGGQLGLTDGVTLGGLRVVLTLPVDPPPDALSSARVS
ncbi:MAG: two-component sensor histidine kinase [Alphaproteobacteria bacterium]|jgi:two-component system osmolarity sensor histidine kinase EnvZ|nr:two-component sensor histidine kinase [Alphaproteobacteria bacterium]